MSSLSAPYSVPKWLLDKIAGLNILVIGDLIADQDPFVIDIGISREASVPVLAVQREEYRPGGASNVAVNVAALGAKSRIVGQIGSDLAGQQIKEHFIHYGVEPSLQVHPGRTATKVRVRSLEGAHRFRMDFPPSAPQPVDPETAGPLVEKAHALLLSDYGYGALTPDSVRWLISLASQRSIPVLADSRSQIHRFGNAMVLCPNVKEATAQVGFQIDGPAAGIRAAQMLSKKLGVDHVVVKLGEAGLVYASRDGGEAHFKAEPPRPAIESTGAGDTVLASLGVGLAAGFPIEKACRLAVRAAGAVVLNMGRRTASTWALTALIEE